MNSISFLKSVTGDNEALQVSYREAETFRSHISSELSINYPTDVYCPVFDKHIQNSDAKYQEEIESIQAYNSV